MAKKESEALHIEMAECPSIYRSAKMVFEKVFILAALSVSDGNVSKAARTTGLTRRHFQTKMQQCGITLEDIRGDHDVTSE